MSVRPLARWMRDEGRAGKENDGGDEGGRGDVAKHVHSMAQPTGNRSGMDPEQVRPVRSQEMQFGAAEVHTAVPHAAGQSAPATTMDGVHSKRRAKLSLSEETIDMHLAEMHRVLKRHSLLRAPSRPVECATLPSDTVQAGGARRHGIRRDRAFGCGDADASTHEAHSSGGRAPSHQMDARLVLGRRRGWGEWRARTMETTVKESIATARWM